MLTIPEKAPRSVSTALGGEDRHLDSLMSFQSLSDASSTCATPRLRTVSPENALSRAERQQNMATGNMVPTTVRSLRGNPT